MVDGLAVELDEIRKILFPTPDAYVAGTDRADAYQRIGRLYTRLKTRNQQP